MFRLQLYALMGIQLIAAFAAVVLLERMTPAIKLILSENVYSLEAVEDMLAVLAGPTRQQGIERFEEALKRAQDNITEKTELPLLNEIALFKNGALHGDANAKARVVRVLVQLGDVNRGAMEAADKRARQLGLGGSWAIVLLGLTGFLFGLTVIRSISIRLIEPIEEMTDVLSDWRKGDVRRRCTLAGKSGEFTPTMKIINELLDHSQT